MRSAAEPNGFETRLCPQSPALGRNGAQSYARFLDSIKERIRTAQVKAALAANAELVLHYWEIGRDILANQARQGWGAKVIDRLAAARAIRPPHDVADQFHGCV